MTRCHPVTDPVKETLHPVITIDGPGGAGKGTVSMRLASELGFNFLDSGALYRLVAVAAMKRGIEPDNERALTELASGLNLQISVGDNEVVYCLDGEEVGHKLRAESVSVFSSHVASLANVRAALVDRQRAFRQAPGLVADGRDMGTVIFPDAVCKIFLTASADERARRRYKQLKDKGLNVSLAALSRDIEKRDRRDSERTLAPLKPAMEARLLDTTGRTIEDVTQQVLDWVAEL